MSIAEELEQLIALRVQGMLSEDEFNQAKHELLTRRSDRQLAPRSDALSKQEEYLRWQHELAQLERDWKREQEGYKVKERGPYGGRSLPTKESSLLCGGITIL
ncbi:MAG: SHOCT domain-containing protein, partial [Chloroflexi bacterium]|nr:SHOCT domain-containing protein [Chloroflexota bacterium]